MMRNIPGKSDSEMEKGEKQTFSRNERLCRTRLIEELFEKGNTFHTSVFKVFWVIPASTIPSPAQIAVSVPKKGFRHATDRNLLKRRIRESYRRRKHKLYSFLQEECINITFILIYRSSKIAGFELIDRAVEEVIEKLCKSASSLPGKS
ncbi:MAG: ribonuclease P protein component [Bacteroidales bacterium]|nr:ribonuclease P protein component [Bacteroidales bacterium]